MTSDKMGKCKINISEPHFNLLLSINNFNDNQHIISKFYLNNNNNKTEIFKERINSLLTFATKINIH